MLPFLKKKSEAAAAAALPPAWHPNFRNFERLPDTKVVRTAFFINGIAVLVAVMMLLWCAYQEYNLFDLRRQISAAQAQIDRDQKPSAEMIALHKQFQAAAARVTEVDTFIKSKPLMSASLLRLAEILPGNIALDGFDFRNVTTTIQGTVRGAPDQASGYASSYLQLLKADPVLAETYEEITLVNLSRNPQTGRLLFEISLKLKGTPKGAKK
ncbi:PilN domain-containing protein [Opitutus terrae]|uniref:Fimbrial assembly family protein n=1 Tax=Opitutus terrae (strain DSM 11246 / JCM 15787 / PB90-1) TaxID=452637 RepID=B1ZTI7_OPITP|nr:hypothetical protein [Opitutus terrae]ACB73932.1 hypothetical protein Oter_0642 [Opitutus terrae PB90-1]